MGNVEVYNIETHNAELMLYGHTHTQENLVEEKGVLEELLEESDTVALEHLGSDAELQEGVKIDLSTDNYVENFMTMIEDADIEYAYGPDSKTGLPHYTFGVLMPLAFIYGIAFNRGYGWAKNNKEELKSLNTDELEWPLQDFSTKNISRRELIAGVATTTGMYSVGWFDTFQPDEVEGRIDGF
ncbi:MAG: hypothetical protein V5A72_03425, partial [Candidatus Nanohaloarchaea archaeon]